MQSIGSKEILLLLLILFVIYVIAMMFAAEGWVIYRLVTGRRVLPESPLVERRPVPWGFWTVLLTCVLYIAVMFGGFVVYAWQTGRLPARSLARRGAVPAAAPDAGRIPRDKPQVADVKPASADQEKPEVRPNQKLEQAAKTDKDLPVVAPAAKTTPGELGMSLTEGLAVQAVINVILLMLIPLILRITSRSPLSDLGLHFDRWWLQAAIGVVAFLAIQPVIFLVQLAMTRIWNNNPHPLYEMVLDEFSPGVPQLAILLAVVIAPVFEEVLFRGIIQSWLVSLGSRRRRRTKPILVGAAAIEGVESSELDFYWTPDSPPLMTDLTDPVEHIPSQPPVAADDPSLSRTSGLAGIVVTSLIFAALHGPQWPAPIALFILSVLIGYVYYRTGSLLAAICLHATFNGFSTLLLLGYLLAPQSAQHPEKKALKPAVAAPVTLGISAVPGRAFIACEK